ncbi:MAG: SPOR domain-containing protein [Panacagrimonas sp.]
MDDLLLQRLLGILCLLLLALALSWILPRPGLFPGAEEQPPVLAMDLSSPEGFVEQRRAEKQSDPPKAPPLPQESEMRFATPAEQGYDDVGAFADQPDPAPAAPSVLPPPSPPSDAPPQSRATTQKSKPAPREEIVQPRAEKPPPLPPPPKPAPEKKPERLAAESPPPKPKPAPTKPPTPKPAPEEPPKPAAPPPVPSDAGGNWYVQVGAYGMLDNAERVRGKLRAIGVNSIISPAETSKGALYRVRSGPYARGKADAVKKQLAAAGMASSVVPP